MQENAEGRPVGMNLAIGVDDKLSFWENLLYGLQHVTVLILGPLITPIIFASVFKWDLNIVAYLMMIMIVGAGIETAIQSRILKLPVAQAQHIVFIAVIIPAVFAVGPVMVWIGLAIVSFITILLVIPFKKGLIGKLMPFLAVPVILGPLFIVMGISLAKVASIDLIFPYIPDVGLIVDPANVILAAITIVVPLFITFFISKGPLRFACVIWGILAAVIVAIFMGKIDFARIAAAPWFMSPKFITKIFEGNLVFGQPRPIAFTWSFIPILIIFFIAEITNVIDTVGCYRGTASLCGQDMPTQRTNRGLFVETACSLITILFGNIPCTSYSQNLGVLSLTRVGAKTIMVYGGLFLVVIGLIFKIAVFFSVIPWAIYGGAMVMILGMLIFIGIQILMKMEMTETKKLIASFSVIAGICLIFIPKEVTDKLPGLIKFFTQNPIGTAVLLAIVLNIVFVHWLKSPGK